jgi:BolA family transcriptional regulator, general stress-responsive regulator
MTFMTADDIRQVQTIAARKTLPAGSGSKSSARRVASVCRIANGVTGVPNVIMEQRIVARLTEALNPIALDVVDESDRHAGHAGAREDGGTHYRVRIVSARFESRSRVERHRLVYDLLTAEFADGLHALALVAKAPGER